MTMEKEIKEIQNSILDAIESVYAPLTAIALLKMADEFYTKTDRIALLDEYNVVRKAYFDAFIRQNKAQQSLSKDIGNIEAVFEEASGRFDEFNSKHPLIVRLNEACKYLKTHYVSKMGVLDDQLPHY